jgi:hypothetical protein
VLCLPTGTAVDVATVEVICDVLASAVRHGPEIARRLRGSHVGHAA